MEPLSPEAGMPSVIVVAAFHKPSLRLAELQAQSLLQQTGVRLTLVAVLDGAETAEDTELTALLHRTRFVITANEKSLGVKRAFAEGLRHALALAPSDDTYFAYCDQDDVWHPQKLSRCVAVARANSAALVHCDARIVDESGVVIAPSLYRFEGRREPDNLFGMLLLNTVTGMTALFSAQTARLALAVLDCDDGPLLHDHVTAAAAASIGRIYFLDEQLVDYIQHSGNQIGAKPHRLGWRERAFGLAQLAAYRRTSAIMFEERRPLAAALARQGKLPRAVNVMFLADRRPGFIAFEVSYISAIARLLARGQFRRAMLALRMMDAAFAAFLWSR